MRVPSATARCADPQRRGLLGAIFVLALSARLAYASLIVGMNTPPVDDAAQYDAIARSISTGGPFSTGEGWRSTRAPGFPFLLGGLYALTGPSLPAARIMQAVVGASTSLLVAIIGMRVAGVGSGAAAALFHALFPYAIAWCGVLLSEPLCTLLALGATAALLWARGDRGHAAWGGLCALCALTRPNMGLMFPLGLAWLFWGRRERLRGPLVATLAFLVVLAPWGVRNYLVHQRLIPITTMGGVVLWEGNNPYVMADPRLAGRSVHAESLPEAAAAQGLSEADRDARYFRLAVDYMTGHWREMPGLFIAKFRRIVNLVPDAGSAPQRIVASTALVILFAGFIAGLLAAWRRRASWTVPLLLPVVAVLVTGVIYWADARVRAPAEPELILVAACGLALLAGAREGP